MVIPWVRDEDAIQLNKIQPSVSPMAMPRRGTLSLLGSVWEVSRKRLTDGHAKAGDPVRPLEEPVEHDTPAWGTNELGNERELNALLL